MVYNRIHGQVSLKDLSMYTYIYRDYPHPSISVNSLEVGKWRMVAAMIAVESWLGAAEIQCFPQSWSPEPPGSGLGSLYAPDLFAGLLYLP